jgi:hypothetical protein
VQAPNDPACAARRRFAVRSPVGGRLQDEKRNCVKKFFRKIRTSIKVPAIKVPAVKPLYLIIAVVAIVVLIVLAIVLLGGGSSGGGGDEAGGGPGSARGFAEGDRSRLPGADTKPVKEAPTVRTGKLDEARREGRLAVAQARGTVVSPSRVTIRVNAAPKQTVRVNWQLGCFKDRRSRIGTGEYRTRTPDARSIALPVQGAKSCIATASAQLTRSDRSGRIKVAVYSGG